MTYPTPEQLDEIINGPHEEMTEDDWDELFGDELTNEGEKGNPRRGTSSGA